MTPMPIVKEIMRPAVTVEETTTLREVVDRMITEKRNSLIVTNSSGVFVGAVNAIDVIKAVLPDYLEEDAIAAHFADQSLLEQDVAQAEKMPVKEFMNAHAPTITPLSGVLEAAARVIQGGQGRIVVVDDAKKPVGIITRTEIKQVIGKLLGLNSSE